MDRRGIEPRFPELQARCLPIGRAAQAFWLYRVVCPGIGRASITAQWDEKVISDYHGGVTAEPPTDRPIASSDPGQDVEPSLSCRPTLRVDFHTQSYSIIHKPPVIEMGIDRKSRLCSGQRFASLPRPDPFVQIRAFEHVVGGGSGSCTRQATAHETVAELWLNPLVASPGIEPGGRPYEGRISTS